MGTKYRGADGVLRERVEAVVTGSNVADDTSLSASFVDDGSGYGVMRVVDAAPFAYDETNTSLRTVSGYELRGLIAARPAATAVAAGTVFVAADRVGQTNFASMSDGTNWTNL